MKEDSGQPQNSTLLLGVAPGDFGYKKMAAMVALVEARHGAVQTALGTVPFETDALLPKSMIQ
jgi:hypothetical protein